MKHLKLTIDRILGLDPGYEPQIRVRMGTQSGETPVGTFVPASGEYEAYSTINFDVENTFTPIEFEVIDKHSANHLGWASINDWAVLVDQNRTKKLRLKLDTQGSIRVELKYFAMEEKIPDRIDLVVHCADGLVGNIRKPYVFINMGDKTVTTDHLVEYPVNPAPGHFEWTDTHTLPYNGERVLVIQVSHGDDQPIGRCRYDLWEVLHDVKNGRTLTGRINLTDPAGYQTGTVSLYCAIWDTSELLERAASLHTSLESITKRRERDEALFHSLQEYPTQDVATLAEADTVTNFLNNADRSLGEGRSVYNELVDPNTTSNFDDAKLSIERHCRDAVLDLEQAERLLRQLAIQVASAEHEVARTIRGQITQAARDVMSASPTQTDGSNPLGVTSTVSDMLQEMQRQDDIILDNIRDIKMAALGSDVQDNLKNITEARKALEGLLVEIQVMSDEALRGQKDSRLRIRKENNLAFKSMNMQLGTAGQRDPALPVCWGCCLCCPCL